MNIAYYSLVLTEKQEVYQRQWLRSIQSLRLHNRNIPVYLFLLGPVPESLRRAADKHEVVLRPLGEYRELLIGIAGKRGEALSCIPTLHKFLTLEHIPGNASQVLYLDCDTFFFGDVSALFSGYHVRQWYAREEPGASDSVLFPYNPRHIDEEALRRIAARAGCRPVPPYNSGVVMMNHGVWKQLSALRRDFLSWAWMLTIGASLIPEINLPPSIKHFLPDPGSGDPEQYLEYPSRNYWILEQIALWLTLGMIPGLSHAKFPPSAVLQNGEFTLYKSFRSACTLVHYFSWNEPFFLEQIQQRKDTT
jgi:hypothetical protein